MEIYSLSLTLHPSPDINECNVTPEICGRHADGSMFKCADTEGSYNCACGRESGYRFNILPPLPRTCIGNSNNIVLMIHTP